MADSKKSFRSLSIRLPLLFVSSVLVIMVIVIPLVHYRFHSRMIDQYERMAEGITRLMANAIDGDKVEEYIERNFEMEEYRELHDYLKSLRENYPDTLYVYVYRIDERGGTVVFDIAVEGVEDGEAFEVGSLQELDEPFQSRRFDIMEGKEVPGAAVYTQYGYLYSYIRPVYKSDGTYACSAAVDFSMDYLAAQDRAFTLRLALILIVITGLILVIGIIVIRKRITEPINTLSECAKKFAYNTNRDRLNNIQLLDGAVIRTGDEIESVYQMLRSVTRDSFMATTNLSRARDDIQTRDEKITKLSRDAYVDKLTQVRNIAAYRRDTAVYDEEIRKGDAKLAVVMFDVNNLKYVNDTYGHSLGDSYIRGCANMICEEYKHSPVYRIGGDEFVVIVRGVDYEARDARFEHIQKQFAMTWADETREMYERYSASAGMAVCTKEDERIECVFNRADEAMYTAKAQFRAKAGRYR